MNRSRLLCLGCAAGLLLAAGQASAHGIESNLERVGGLSAGIDFSRTATGGRAPAASLQLQSHFSNGLPASEAAVRLMPPGGGTPIEVGRTDEQGRLTFALPARAGSDWEIQVDAGPGHRDYLEVPPAGGNHGADPGTPHAAGLLPRATMVASQWAVLSPLAVLGLISTVGGWRRWRQRS